MPKKLSIRLLTRYQKWRPQKLATHVDVHDKAPVLTPAATIRKVKANNTFETLGDVEAETQSKQ